MTREDASAIAAVIRSHYADGNVPDDVEAFIEAAVRCCREGVADESATWSAFQAGEAYGRAADQALADPECDYDVPSMFDAYEEWKQGQK